MLLTLVALLLPAQAYASDFGMIPVIVAVILAGVIELIHLFIVIPGLSAKYFCRRRRLIGSWVLSAIALLLFSAGLCLMFSMYSLHSRHYRDGALPLLGVTALLLFNLCAPTIQYYKGRRNGNESQNL